MSVLMTASGPSAPSRSGIGGCQAENRARSSARSSAARAGRAGGGGVAVDAVRVDGHDREPLPVASPGLGRLRRPRGAGRDEPPAGVPGVPQPGTGAGDSAAQPGPRAVGDDDQVRLAGLPAAADDGRRRVDLIDLGTVFDPAGAERSGQPGGEPLARGDDQRQAEPAADGVADVGAGEPPAGRDAHAAAAAEGRAGEDLLVDAERGQGAEPVGPDADPRSRLRRDVGRGPALEHLDVPAAAPQARRGGEPSDSAADDEGAPPVHQ